jgi:hypothetical protein
VAVVEENIAREREIVVDDDAIYLSFSLQNSLSF